jgi:hypothetical protein
MENIPGDKCDEYGCFVYHVLESAHIEVRTCKNVEDKFRSGLIIEVGGLVSVDFISPSRHAASTNGPFLRLTDDSGWLFEKKYGEIVLERVPVTIGLWCFYIDNGDIGMALRRHPYDGSPHVDPKVTYPSMQMVYCDRKVIHPSNGVTSYRVQGTNGWIFDKRLDNEGGSTSMMLPDSFVKTGLFAYELLEDTSVVFKPSASLGSNLSLRKTEIVCCDIIRTDGNGPYLRLTDGTGWIFEKKDDPLQVRRLIIHEGKWTFEIMNNPAGIVQRWQPIDSQRMRNSNTTYATGDHVECDRKVTSSTSGVSFYRVIGTDGWIFDRRNDEPMLKLLKSRGQNSEDFVLGDNQNPWSVDLVRGIAIAYDIQEISHNVTSRCISFRTDSNERINVYYTTRTIGTALDHPSQGKTQLFRRKCTIDDLKQILQNTRYHTRRGYKKQRREEGDGMINSTPYGRGICVDDDDEEEVSRNSLLECDANILKLYKKRDYILKSIKRHDDQRVLDATKMKTKIDHYRKRLEHMYEKSIGKQRQEAAAAAEKEMLRQVECIIEKQRNEMNAADYEERCSQVERTRIAKFLTCGECYHEFSSERARDQHCRDAHGLQCNHCGKTFKSQNGLNNHRSAVGHW